MVAAISVLAVLGFAQAPLPPYRRLETVVVTPERYQVKEQVVGSAFYVGLPSVVRAYSLLTLKPLWTRVLPKGALVSNLCVAGNKVFVTCDVGENRSRLIALNSKEGKPLWSVGGTGGAGAVAALGNTVYAAVDLHRVCAFDIQTHRLKWKAEFPAGKEGRMSDTVEAILATPERVLVEVGNRTRAISATTGKPVWDHGPTYMVFQKRFVETDGIVWVTREGGSDGFDIRTGKSLWQSTAGPDDFGGVFGGNFVGLSQGQLHCINPKTGRDIWSLVVGESGASGGRQYGAPLEGKLFVRGMKRAVIVDPMGKTLWEGKDDLAIPPPIFFNGAKIVCFDASRLLVYEHGSRATIPTDSAGRQAMAAKLLGEYDKLDAEDVRTLDKLEDDAFPGVLSEFMKACARDDAKSETDYSMGTYDKYHALAETLEKISKPQRTEELLQALSKTKAKGSAKPFLLSILAKVGDPNVIAPFFVKELENTKTPGWEMYESNTFVAREYVERSSAPAAVAFLMKQLKDPKADPTLRESAYDFLAGTGGEEGLKAVLAERHHRTLLPPLAQRVVGGYLGAGEFGTRSRVLHEKADASGHVWGLLQCGILGSSGDLWLAEKVNGKWVNPLFTGVSLSGVSRWAKPAPAEPTIGGKTAKQLESGAWFEVLVKNEEIRRDSANCGVTDLEKKRLGLDPTKKDTDGDGDADEVDPWPNAPQRELTDAEQVIAAAFEARYHFDRSQGPALFYAPWDMKPFEMPGRNGPTLWVPFGTKDRWSLPLEQCYEQGIAFINIRPSVEERKGNTAADTIQWNKDRTEAKLTISTYYGGLNGTGYEAVVRKFATDWVVVSLRMAYIS